MRGLLVDFIKEHVLEVPADKSSVCIPPLTPLHKLVGDRKPVATKSVAAVSDGSSSSSGIQAKELSASKAQSDEDESQSFLSSSKSLDPWAAKPAIALNIHRDGLIAIDHNFPLPPSSSSSSNSNDNSTSTSTSGFVESFSSSRRPMAGSSSVGGWGVDKGVAWKAVSLPSPPPAPATIKRSGTVSYSSAAASGVVDKNVNGGSGKVGKGPVSSAGFLADVSADTVVRKDELFKLVLAKASPYYGIVGPDGVLIMSLLLRLDYSPFLIFYFSVCNNFVGRLSVHSGQVRKALVLVETRMGNKVMPVIMCNYADYH